MAGQGNKRREGLRSIRRRNLEGCSDRLNGENSGTALDACGAVWMASAGLSG
jgi:hypothetical protein